MGNNSITIIFTNYASELSSRQPLFGEIFPKMDNFSNKAMTNRNC